MFAVVGAFVGAFGFDNGEGVAVVAPEDVVDVAFAAGVCGDGHSGDFDFGGVGGAGVPACFAQEDVDEVFAGFGFVGVVVVVVCDFGVGRFELV